MTLKERCQAGEAKLERVSNLLLDPRVEILDLCEAELQEVIALLESDKPAVSDKSDKDELIRLRNKVRLLSLQVQHAVNLFQGWAQLGLSQGYTDQGRPALAPSEPAASYEV